MGVKWKLCIKIVDFLLEWQYGTSYVFCAFESIPSFCTFTMTSLGLTTFSLIMNWYHWHAPVLNQGIVISDHAPVVLSLVLPDLPQVKKKHWRFHSTLLSDNDFVNFMKVHKSFFFQIHPVEKSGILLRRTLGGKLFPTLQIWKRPRTRTIRISWSN